MNGLNELAKEIHKRNIEKGFFEGKNNIGEMLCLIHSEVSEALEADRKAKYCNQEPKLVLGWVSDEDFHAKYREKVKGSFEEEMGDIFIRVLDMCAYKNIDLENHVKCKMRYNSLREYKHGKKY